jgi:hypothetical protein
MPVHRVLSVLLYACGPAAVTAPSAPSAPPAPPGQAERFVEHTVPTMTPGCPTSGPLLTDRAGLVEVLQVDLNNDGMNDAVLASAPLPVAEPVDVWVLVGCDDGLRVAHHTQARDLRPHGPKLSGWDVLRAEPSALLAYSLQRGAYVPAAAAAREVGCPVFGRSITQLVPTADGATLDGKPHRVAWTGALNDDALPDHVLVEQGEPHPEGPLFRVLAGCTEHKAALMLEGRFSDLRVLDREGPFAAVQTDGEARTRWTLRDLDLGLYQPAPASAGAEPAQ